MKFLTVCTLVFVYLSCYSQQEEFQLEGMVVDSTSQPIADVYIINLRSHEKSVSKQNGIFEMSVLPDDSLILTHISFDRKIIHVFTLLKNPVITLMGENLKIRQVDVSPNKKTDYQRAMDNISSISNIKYYDDPKIDIESELSMQMMTEHNRYLRSEATSVRLLRFSPSEEIQKLIRSLKKKKRQ